MILDRPMREAINYSRKHAFATEILKIIEESKNFILRE